MNSIILPRAAVHRGALILVNASHPLADGFSPALAPLSGDGRILLDRTAAALLRACIQACGGESEIVAISGWRSQDEQQRIWDDSLAGHGERFTRRYVALPGCSEHQTGLAIDLGRAARRIDFIRPAFPNHGACGRFRRMAAGYGFIERYQHSKEAVTGIAAEPWHFRYVGAPHARLIHDHGLCLEEYVPFLRDGGARLCPLGDGRCAQVFYVPCQGETTEIELPGEATISGDNDGGFIVTLWSASRSRIA